MKNYISKLLLLIIVLVQTGCSEKLDLDPKSTLTDKAFWKTPNDFKLAANDFYTWFPSHAAFVEAENLNNDLIAGEATNNVSNSTYTVPASDNNWSTGYSRLRAVNYFLEKAQNYPLPDEISLYVAEAKFFRAYAYWNLFRRFGGVPLINKVLGVDSPELFSSRASRSETCDQILSDLDAAIQSLPLETDIASRDKGRISKGAAQALAARIALYEGTWNKFRGNDQRANAFLDKAILYSDLVITANTYQLFFNSLLGQNSYRYLFIIENEKSNPAGVGKSANKEYILINKFDFTIRQAGTNITGRQQSYFCSPTNKMADMYLCSDGLPIETSPLFQGKLTPVSEFQNRDPRMTMNLRVPGQKYWSIMNNGRVNWTGDEADLSSAMWYVGAWGNTRTGYNSLKWCTERNNGIGSDKAEGWDIPLIRLAEVYLINAEAKFERHGVISDADLDLTINKLRDRVGMIHLTNALVAAGGLNMRNEIRRERNVELYNEGFRYDDLIRWKTAEIELPMALTGALITGTWHTSSFTFAPGAVYSPLASWNGKLDANGYYQYEPASNRQFTEKYYQFPIPTNEIILNPNLEQNTGW
jgi:starch-binding outer membrane protein, SusD/RagB family